jgi:hypothetical protein
MAINTNTSFGISIKLKADTLKIIKKRNKGIKITDFSKHVCEALEEYNKKFNNESR